MRKKFLLFGATGSIGDSTLDILRQYPDDFELAGFTWHHNEAKARAIAAAQPQAMHFSTQGPEAAAQTQRLLEREHDFVIIAIVGAAGVHATLAAAERGSTILLANKESLVMAGQIVNAAAKKSGAQILPVDSEHSSLWRLLSLPHARGITEGAFPWLRRAYLTASGGPLLHLEGEEFYNASKEVVLKHPTWVMGQKITVDSAGLTNKALEVIEAHYLFHLPYEKIQAVIHPQSYVHAIIEASDGTVMQHVSQPDMRYPIAYAMYHPQEPRICAPERPPATYPALEFMPVDEVKFRSYALGRRAGEMGGYFPTVYNAANEAAVAAFLGDNIRFGEIAELIEYALSAKYAERDFTSLDGMISYDNAARALVKTRAMRV